MEVKIPYQLGMMQWVKNFGGRSKALPMLASLGLVTIVGLVDYRTGWELEFYAFYLIPVVLAAWFVGRAFAIFVSLLCVAVSITGDVVAGIRYSSDLVPIWNALIWIATYAAFVWVLAKLRSLYDELEQRVRQRTAALQDEVQERIRLEEEILSISEREQVRIGRDLHDSLCQHLTGMALAGKVVSEQLVNSPSQAEAVKHIVRLTGEAIELTRKLARGLYPVELKGEGLIDALRELEGITREHFKIACRFECNAPTSILKHEDAVHLYRIAQEATTNALRHGYARQIVIRLVTEGGFMTLTVSDDGVGLPDVSLRHNGMGLRIMAHRASLIGAMFRAERLPSRGTRISCKISVNQPSFDEKLCPSL